MSDEESWNLTSSGVANEIRLLNDLKFGRGS
jgi:hypothetical protein